MQDDNSKRPPFSPSVRRRWEPEFCGTPLQSFLPATEEEVATIIKLTTNKSCELDPVSTTIVKQCSEEITPLVTRLVNASPAHGDVPDNMKTAVVRPLLKKANLDHDTLKNDRPIFNLSFVSKVPEKVVAKRLDQHISYNELADPMQSAYRVGHSTETALVKVQADITSMLDAGGMVVLIMLDLSAAFDTLENNIGGEHGWPSNPPMEVQYQYRSVNTSRNCEGQTE